MTVDFRKPLFPSPWLHSLRSLVEILFSFPCPGCRETFPDAQTRTFCNDCLKRVRCFHGPRCTCCGGLQNGILALCPDCLKEEKRPWRKGMAVFPMEGYGRELIHQFKYGNRPELARPLGILAAAELVRNNIDADILVPMPIHWTRKLSRGYNQAELLCRILSAETGIPSGSLLQRNRATRQQANLGKDERVRNVEKVFSAIDRGKSRNRVIVLVDDVMTTGSTLASAVKALMNAGAGEVYTLVLARGY